MTRIRSTLAALLLAAGLAACGGSDGTSAADNTGGGNTGGSTGGNNTGGSTGGNNTGGGGGTAANPALTALGADLVPPTVTAALAADDPLASPALATSSALPAELMPPAN